MLGSNLYRQVNCIPDSSGPLVHTVKPLFSVVDSVLEPYVTGVARPLVKGDRFLALTALMACLERKLCCRFKASRREAIAFARDAEESEGMGDGGVMGGLRSVYLELPLLGRKS